MLHKVKEERNIIDTVNVSKANWIGHILRRNCLLKLIALDEKRRDENEREVNN
jgi:hypothetical protein